MVPKEQDRKLRPLLNFFQLRRASFSNQLSEKATFQVTLKREVSIEIEEQNSPVPPAPPAKTAAAKKSKKSTSLPTKFRGIGYITITAVFAAEDSTQLDGLSASADYLCRFAFSDKASARDVTNAMGHEHYQYLFVAQVLPLALKHFKEQLQSMGLNTSKLPIGVV